MFWSDGCSLLRAEPLKSSPVVVNCNFLSKNINKISCCNFFLIFGHQNPGSVIGSGFENGSGSAVRKNAGSRSALNQCGSITLFTTKPLTSQASDYFASNRNIHSLMSAVQISAWGGVCVQDIPRLPAGGSAGGADLLHRLLVALPHHLRQAQGRWSSISVLNVDPRSWFLPIPDPGSRISDPKQQWKTGVKKNELSYLFFGAINFTKLNYFIYEMLKKKIWANFQRII